MTYVPSSTPAQPTHRPLRDDTGTRALPGGLPLDLGGHLAPCRVGYRLAGPDDAPPILVMGGISAHRDPWARPGGPERGWWDALVGPGKAVDPERVRVLAFDWVGGAGASSPAVSDRGILPVTPGDQARALALLAGVLDLPPFEAVVGASYGGAVALALAQRHPELVRRALVIGAAHASHPMATALRVAQRRIVRLAASWGRVEDGLALARLLAMTTYRTDRELEARFGGPPELEPGGPRFPVEPWLDHHGRRFAETFHPDAFLCLSQSLDLHRVDPAAVTVPVTLVSVHPDAVAPRWQMRELRRRLGPGHGWIEVESLRGHDAFLTDVEVFDGILRRFLDGPAADGSAT